LSSGLLSCAFFAFFAWYFLTLKTSYIFTAWCSRKDRLSHKDVYTFLYGILTLCINLLRTFIWPTMSLRPPSFRLGKSYTDSLTHWTLEQTRFISCHR
jgi:hypothetical protein